MAYAPLAQRTVVVEGIKLPARCPTATDLQFSRAHRRKDDAATRCGCSPAAQRPDTWQMSVVMGRHPELSDQSAANIC